MEYNSGSNRASNFKSAEHEARGRFEVTSTITPLIVTELQFVVRCENEATPKKGAHFVRIAP